MKCKDCRNAQWELTPTGRIKKSQYGKCAKQAELIEQFTRIAPPCIIAFDEPRGCVIWPDYPAGNCPAFVLLQDQ